MTAALAGLSRTLAADLPSAAPGRAVLIEGWVHRRRVLGAVTFLILRDRSGLAQVVVRDPEALRVVRRCGEESVVAVTGVATRNPAAPGGVEVTEPTDHAARRARAAAAGRRCGGPRSTPGCPRSWTTPPCPGGIRPGGRAGSWPPRRCAASGPRWTSSASPRSRRRSSCRRPPSPAPPCSAWTTSGARPTWPSPRSSTSRRWSASSSGSTRPGRCSAPSRTTPPGTWPSTSRSTPSSASSTTTATCWRCSGTRWPG